ncbi:Zn-dependent hydrolase [Salibacterium salarium]|uniref:Zn-dependent hydrolase n=1 Tax=Salibacterium salarium TaxID=284579 RepID=A0A3R9Q2W9_9BACI|nr:Zn-dependent hydrolase [Salibacterium salarium]RSL32423.1 Zn-dependent hydrolase [Salibacterium salarium]
MSTNSSLSFLPNNQVDSMIDWLYTFGPTKDQGTTRLLYSEPWIQAQQSIYENFKKQGLTPSFDDVGNLYGRVEGTDSHSSAIVTGSHIDSVVNGGKYDGTYGIISSLLAVTNLIHRCGPPKKPMEVVSLCEEEGSRFPLTFWGSGNITGKYAGKNTDELFDKEGVSLTQAMHDAGFGKGNYTNPVRNDIGSFIELHIEQGNVLEQSGNSLGIVESIVGQRRYNIYVTGQSNHAGTTPMSYRKDAMSTASLLINWITSKVTEVDPNLVATIGKIEAKPNTPNVIAGEVMFTLDVRHHLTEVLDSFCKDMFEYFNEVIAQSGVQVSSSQWMDVNPVKMDSHLTTTAYETTKQFHLPSQYMISGAGHDAQMFGMHYPTSLIFVPSHKGISHAPQEFTKKEDLDNGIQMLTEMLYNWLIKEG